MARGVLLAYGPARARLWMSKWSLKRLSLFTSTDDNSIVALMRTPAIPEEGDPHGAASIFGRMMARGVRIAYGSVRAMDRGIRIHGLPADIWAATKILFQTLRHPLLRNGEPMLEVAWPVCVAERS